MSSTVVPRSGHLAGDPEVCARFAADGITTVAELLDRSHLVRDLPDRSNHTLELAGERLYVKRTKRARKAKRGVPPEARALLRLGAARVPTAPLAVYGVDPELGAVTATFALDPARPLDELLTARALTGDARRRALARLASLVATLHAAGLHHRDLYLNHLYLDPADPASVIRVIDVERVGRHRRALGRWVVKDLAALLSSVPDGSLSEREATCFLIEYLRHRGIPRRGVVEGLVRRVRKKAARIAAHEPRTPVGDAARPVAGD